MNNKAVYILIVVGVLGMTTVGAATYTGRAVSGRLSEQTAQLTKLMPELRVEEHIERGPFRTLRVLKMQLGCLPMPGKDGTSLERTAPIEVHWRDVIHHVPFVSAPGKVASIDSELEIPAAGVEQLFGTRAPLTMHTNVAMDGRFDGDAKLASFKLAPKPGHELEFSGLVMHYNGSSPDGAGKFSYTGSSEPIQLRAKAEDGNFAATVGAMQLTGNMQMDPTAPSFFMPYHSEMRIADLTAQVTGPAKDGAAPTDFNFALQGVTANVDNTVENDLLTATSQMQGSLKFDSFAIDKIEMGSTVRNLHVPTLTKLTRAWMKQSSSCDAPQTPEALLKQLEEMGSGALELLPHAPEYKFGPIAIELGGKRAELSYALGVHGVAAGSSPEMMELLTKYGYANAEAKLNLGLIDQLAGYASKLSAKAAGVHGIQQPAMMPQGAPDPMAMMARGMIEGFAQQGFLEREGDTVRARVEYEQGAVKLNGNPVQLPDFKGMDLDAVKRSIAAGGVEADDSEPDAAQPEE